MYQHDNAPAHTACLTVNFLAANRILVLDYSPLSPDMSPIELLIATLKYKGVAFYRSSIGVGIAQMTSQAKMAAPRWPPWLQSKPR